MMSLALPDNRSDAVSVRKALAWTSRDGNGFDARKRATSASARALLAESSRIGASCGMRGEYGDAGEKRRRRGEASIRLAGTKGRKRKFSTVGHVSRFPSRILSLIIQTTHDYQAQ